MKKNIFNNLVLAVSMMFGLGTLAHAGDTAKQNIVVKVSHGTDDLHSSVMAMKIASMLQKKGAEVTLFFNLESVRLLDQRQPDDLSWGHTESMGKLYQEAVKLGVRVVVCPHCAKVAGMTAKNLRAGATLGSEDMLAEMFLKADKVIDY